MSALEGSIRARVDAVEPSLWREHGERVVEVVVLEILAQQRREQPPLSLAAAQRILVAFRVVYE